jgi:transposase-like protein
MPKRMQGWVKATMKKAWAMETVAAAKGKLLDLASQLEGEHPDATASLREGLDETLTITALGVGGLLKKSIYSTNTIENLQGALRRTARNVKRWQGGAMAQRWAVAALAEAQKGFRRVRGYRELPQLMAALQAQVPDSTLRAKTRVA